MAVANAQFQIPNLPAKPAGYIVIDSIKPGIGRLVLALDANGDGSLSRAEIANAPYALGALDRDGNGRIDSSEIAPRPTEISGQRTEFVAEFGIRHADCHDIKQALDIPKIITVRVTKEQAFYANLDEDFSSTVDVQVVGARWRITGAETISKDSHLVLIGRAGALPFLEYAAALERAAALGA